MLRSKISADFQNADSQGRLRLNTVGTLEDLARQEVELRDGLRLTLCAEDADDQGRPDELLVEGVAAFSAEERCWVAAIDWTAIRHASDHRSEQANQITPAVPARPSERV